MDEFKFINLVSTTRRDHSCIFNDIFACSIDLVRLEQVYTRYKMKPFNISLLLSIFFLECIPPQYLLGRCDSGLQRRRPSLQRNFSYIYTSSVSESPVLRQHGNQNRYFNILIFSSGLVMQHEHRNLD